ncbi:hypothetical protein JIP62_05825 [Brevundimonas vitis]|uniref:DUF6456 domain-containing protein n=1 Tax=Brevundimonas vitisensis TaxID=2800818 RepID=A0ABX7BTH4_9CAUL|nr:DUF6456 domain-containing protein [Brevundimonas vitisensis]QQQ19606.1 hypothetical protein JIP62_05825 [Brevundimonas vitisensis]
MTGRLQRARALLARPDAWIGAEASGGYAIRLAPTRRARINLLLDEALFRALIEQPGLRARTAGGWTLRREPASANTPSPGRPGVIDGTRPLMQPDGRVALHPANLGETPIAWLARRRDAQGRPWLTPAQVAAGERLTREAEAALSGPSLTMRWDALPRAGGGSSARVEPGDRALSAGRRVARALDACGPRLRGIFQQVCIQGSALSLAERELGLGRRRGKILLQQGLQALADHYRIG